MPWMIKFFNRFTYLHVYWTKEKIDIRMKRLHCYRELICSTHLNLLFCQHRIVPQQPVNVFMKFTIYIMVLWHVFICFPKVRSGKWFLTPTVKKKSYILITIDYTNWLLLTCENFSIRVILCKVRIDIIELNF